MDVDDEVIALLLPERTRREVRDGYAAGAQRLVRSADGRMSLEAVESREEFERTARSTGCFRRGKAIRDPATREVIGYEMEEVSIAEAAVGM
jgi:hypothetical protein